MKDYEKSSIYFLIYTFSSLELFEKCW
jgi:hypothetical protein